MDNNTIFVLLFIVILITIVITVVILYKFKYNIRNPLKYYNSNIESKTISNNNYRQVEYTDDLMQLVLMSLKPSEEIGMETHSATTQFIRVEKGNGLAIINDDKINLSDGSVVVIPYGYKHNIINTGNDDLKLYTIYTPPEHEKGLIEINKHMN